MKTAIYRIPDYEHRGDIDHAISYIKKEFPEATNFDSWEERDYELESDIASEYGECDEHYYQGYVSFEYPKELSNKLENLF